MQNKVISMEIAGGFILATFNLVEAKLGRGHRVELKMSMYYSVSPPELLSWQYQSSPTNLGLCFGN